MDTPDLLAIGLLDTIDYSLNDKDVPLGLVHNLTESETRGDTRRMPVWQAEDVAIQAAMKLNIKKTWKNQSGDAISEALDRIRELETEKHGEYVETEEAREKYLRELKTAHTFLRRRHFKRKTKLESIGFVEPVQMDPEPIETGLKSRKRYKYSIQALLEELQSVKNR
jgi:hypothetical protein